MENKLVNSTVSSVIVLFLGLFAYLGQRNPEGELPLYIIFVGITGLVVSGLARSFYEKGIEDAARSEDDG